MNVDFQLEANKLIKIQENMQKVTACTPIANVTESLPKGETSSVDLGEKKIKKQTSSLLPVQLQKELAKNSIGKIYDYFNQKKILPFSLEHLKNLSLEQITELFFGLFLLDSVEGYLKNHEASYQNIAKDLTSLYEYIYNGKNLSNEMLICKHKIDLKQAFYGLKTLHNQIDIKKLTLHEMGFGGDCPEEVLFRLCHFMIETKINLVKVYINFTSKIIKNENLNSLSLGKHLYKLIESFRKQINEVENLFQLLQENDSEQYLYVDVVFSTTLLGNVVKIHPILKHLDDFSVSLEELKTNSAEPHVILSQFEEMQYQLKMIKTKIVLQDLLTITINKANFRPAKLPETSKSYKKPNLNWLDYIDKTSLKKKSCRKNENSFPCNPKSLLPLQRHQDEKVSEEFEVNVTEISPPIVVKADISLNSKQQILRKEEYFHLHHLQRTVELINKLDSNSNYAKTLLSMVVNASYHFIEIGQTLNHGYLSHQHGLERFETHPALRENQMGTIWYRYPHSSTSFYPNHDLLPKALACSLQNLLLSIGLLLSISFKQR